MLLYGAIGVAAVGAFMLMKPGNSQRDRATLEGEVLHFFQVNGWLDQLKRDKIAAMSLPDLIIYHAANVLGDQSQKDAAWQIAIANGWGN